MADPNRKNYSSDCNYEVETNYKFNYFIPVGLLRLTIANSLSQYFTTFCILHYI